mmetsp:Transcript_59069/g.71109  ORF Transcript_59069/g.71109 Transcript_59069/m.71109 type:complete len:779 (-) Transcript_59069:207-2543(-)
MMTERWIQFLFDHVSVDWPYTGLLNFSTRAALMSQTTQKNMKYASKFENRPCEHVVFHNCLKEFDSETVIAIQPDLRTRWRKPTGPKHRSIDGSFAINKFPRLKVTTQSADKKKIAWLLSFPNSGTSHTMEFVTDITKNHVATNYGQETKHNKVQVYKDQPEGPFWLDQVKKYPLMFPLTYVMTKSHCGARCVSCPLSAYIESVDEFDARCALDGRKGKPYNTDRVAKVVHLLRNPFDNVVSRLRFDQGIKSLSTKFDESTYANDASSDEERIEKFRNACMDLESYFYINGQKILEHFLPDSLLQDVKDIPCFVEFFKFVKWHNLTFEITKKMKLDSMVLHYDSFEDTKSTSTALSTFLELEDMGEAPIFEINRHYDGYFTQDEVNTIHNAVEQLSSTETWNEVKRYFSLSEPLETKPNTVEPIAVVPGAYKLVNNLKDNDETKFDLVWPIIKNTICPKMKPKTNLWPVIYSMIRKEIENEGHVFLKDEISKRYFFPNTANFEVYEGKNKNSEMSFLYLKMFKCANNNIRSWIDDLANFIDGKVYEKLMTSKDKAVVDNLKKPCAVTAIRDPISHFLSGYNEFEFRMENTLSTLNYVTMKEGSEERFKTFVMEYFYQTDTFLSKNITIDNGFTRKYNKTINAPVTPHLFPMSRFLPILDQLGIKLNYLPSLSKLNTTFPKFVSNSCDAKELMKVPMANMDTHESSLDPKGSYRAAKKVWAEGGLTSRILCQYRVFDYACFDDLPDGVPDFCQQVFSSNSFLDEVLTKRTKTKVDVSLS